MYSSPCLAAGPATNQMHAKLEMYGMISDCESRRTRVPTHLSEWRDHQLQIGLRQVAGQVREVQVRHVLLLLLQTPTTRPACRKQPRLPPTLLQEEGRRGAQLLISVP